MKICPIAIAVGCPSCPAFKVCPAKESLGGYNPAAEAKAKAAEVAKRPAKKPSAKSAKPVGKPTKGRKR